MEFSFWKLRRELLATYDQAQALLISSFFPLIRLKNSLFPPESSKQIKGKRTLDKRVVIYLVFANDDDLADRLLALDYFNEIGSSVICVVNGELKAKWLSDFKERCAYILTRKNIGYDFGGYQCGVLFLTNLQHSYDHLHIINDSVLIPVVQNKTIFLDIECAAESGFGGAVVLPLQKKYSKMGQKLVSDLLVLSYWLYFSGSLARSESFKNYWTRYIATSSKVLTVRYGERGLSRYMAANAYTANAPYTANKVSAIIQNIQSDMLLKILNHASFTDGVFIEKCSHLVSEYEPTSEWSTAARKFIDEVSAKRNFLHSFCFLTYELMDVPFIKKTQLKLPLLMRKKYIFAVENGYIKNPPDKIWAKILNISK
jgi:hypothetical protein